MPIIRTTQAEMGPGNRPEWSTVSSAGVFRVPVENGWFDRHFHDCHEYWLIFKGKAKVLTEGIEYYVKSGDIVCTEAGEEHDILEVYEDLEAFWFEDATPLGSRTGHLHKDPSLSEGHAVPYKPLPEDFPG